MVISDFPFAESGTVATRVQETSPALQKIVLLT
jgi:hypothetical protein